MRRLTPLALALLLALGGLSATAAAKPRRTAACQGDWIPSTPSAEEVMRGELPLAGLPAIRLGKRIDWAASPYRNRSWEYVFHSLRWVGALVAAYENSGDGRYLARAEEITADWVRRNRPGAAKPYVWQDHPVSLRTQTLVCLSGHVKDGWLRRSLAQHAELLADPARYRKGHNHGIDQDIALMAIGCLHRRPDWSRLAVRRLAETVRIDVDAQGALREQAPRYAVYVYGRLQVALANMRACGIRAPRLIVSRAESLKEYVTHSTQPNGYMAPLGDGSAETEPGMATGTPRAKVKVYRAGYVYGRTAWGDQESAYYSIRFGLGRKFHGHEDHLGVTYYAQGRDILVDTGFHSYERGAYRRWTASPQAHNVPVVVGERFRPRTAGVLTGAAYGRNRQVFRLTDKAYGVARTRSVLVNHGQDLMAIMDSAADGKKVRSVWRFADSLPLLSRARGHLVLGDERFQVSLVQLASCARVGGQRVVRGGDIGWVSPTYLSKKPTTVVLSPPAARLLTLVVPGMAEPKVSCAGGRVTVRTATGSVSFSTRSM